LPLLTIDRVDNVPCRPQCFTTVNCIFGGVWFL
jgi:hypothetical protein